MKNNTDDFKKNLAILQKSIYAGIQVGLHKTNIQIKDEVIANSKLQKHGQPYRIVSSGGRVYKGRHSSPDETSARITGKKNRAIRYNVNGLSSKIGADVKVKYAKYVEEGTTNIRAREDTKKAGKKIANKNLRTNIANGVIAKIKENFNNVVS